MADDDTPSPTPHEIHHASGYKRRFPDHPLSEAAPAPEPTQANPTENVEKTSEPVADDEKKKGSYKTRQAKPE